MVKLEISLFVLLMLVNATFTESEVDNDDDRNNQRKVQKKTKTKNDRSTSSSSGAKDSSGGADDSISMTMSSSADSKQKDRSYIPKSSAERTGWRKWHRKCSRCYEDERKKWKDPSIKWICGAYQRARRSFKSSCSMRYRNCQDGTMFVKIMNHRCPNDTGKEEFPHGDHFFYEYRVRLSDETSNEKTSSTGESDSRSYSY